MKKLSCLIAVSFSVLLSLAQTNVPSGEIYLNLKKLNTLGSVLYVAAHPDDENTRLITYFSKDRLFKTGYLSMTRGDGGQNLIGDEQGISLGMIRTQELLAARRIDGGEQFFSRAYDFGYSKTPEETFTKWDREKILSDVVWVIRKFQPDVIITRFPSTGEGGHGHHTASAILANEAFTAAADPRRFPEQLKYLGTWQAKRILWNVFGGNSSNTDMFRIDVGGYNAVLGRSYGEIAADSRSQHKSQGFGVQRSRGEALEYFRTTGGSSPSVDLFDGVDVSWNRVPGGQAVSRLIQNAIDSFDFIRPENSLPALVRINKAIKGIPQSAWKDQKLKEVKLLIEQASGLWMEAFTSEPYVAQGDSLRINFSVNNRLGSTIQLNRINLDSYDTSFTTLLAANKNLVFNKTIFIHGGYPLTQPYWLQYPMQEGYFTVKDQMMIGQPDVETSLTAAFHVRINGEDFYFEKPVRYKFTDPVKGEQYQPLVVRPTFTVYSHPELILAQDDEKSPREYLVEAIANRRLSAKEAGVSLQLEKKNKYQKEPLPAFTKGSKRQYTITLLPEEVGKNELRITPSYKADSIVNMMALAMIQYDHIPWINFFYSDWIKVLPIKLETHGRKIGYIVGAGDKVPEALEQMGYEVYLLTDKELSRNNLQQFDAIISGVRAYNTNEWLNNHYDKLMKYVENGGNLIVQYNTSSNIGPVRAKIGPYSFDIGRNRITDEKAAVNFLKPDHPVLNFPNKITADDFTGWVQERSIYHASRMDPNFETVISMHDPGESNDDPGSLIIAKHGKGYFTYTGLVFFRQLPAGVPGAYRLLANLIALNRKKEF